MFSMEQSTDLLKYGLCTNIGFLLKKVLVTVKCEQFTNGSY